jgi:choline dehydrogenase
MGAADDPEAVVGADCRVRGLEGLWVADASIMPTIPQGNTNATAIMIGERASDLILDRLREKQAA